MVGWQPRIAYAQCTAVMVGTHQSNTSTPVTIHMLMQIKRSAGACDTEEVEIISNKPVATATKPIDRCYAALQISHADKFIQFGIMNV